jgi:outer membrane lipoprotein-sorting protein
MRTSRPLVFLAFALVGCAGLATTGRADGEALAKEVLARSHGVYANARDLQATFEGVSSIYSQGEKFTATIAYQANHASRSEIRYASGNTTTRLREANRDRQWQSKNGELKKEHDRDNLTTPILPFLPAFNIYNDDSAVLVDKRVEAGRPAIYVLEAKLKRPGDPFAAVRLGIEDGTWLWRTIEMLDTRGVVRSAVTFTDVKIDQGIPPGTFTAPAR